MPTRLLPFCAAIARSAGGSTAAPQVAAEVAAYEELAELLHYSAPPASAPAALEARLRSAIGKPLPLPAPTLVSAPELPVPPSRRARTWHWPQTVALVASAAAVLLLLLNLYWLREIRALHASQAILQQQLEAQTAQFSADMAEHTRTLQAQNDQIATQDAILAQLVAGNSERYTMHAVQPGSSAVAQVAWLGQDNTAVLRAEGFPPLQEGQAYQLWLIRGDTRTSGGLFTVDDAGCGTYIFHPTQSLDDFDGMGITPEPAAGSPGPTAPPVVRAQL